MRYLIIKRNAKWQSTLNKSLEATDCRRLEGVSSPTSPLLPRNLGGESVEFSPLTQTRHEYFSLIRILHTNLCVDVTVGVQKRFYKT